MRKFPFLSVSLMCLFSLTACDHGATQPATRAIHSGMAYKLSDSEKQGLVNRADNGDSAAALALGKAWLNSGQSEELGRYWLFRAAIAGSSDGQYNLGMLLRVNGKYESDKRDSVLWLRRAAASGNSLAKDALDREGGVAAK